MKGQFKTVKGCAMAKAVHHQPLTAEAGITPGVMHMGFAVDKVALEEVSHHVLWVSRVNIIPPWPSIPIYHLRDER
jgi:hypothetical protein